jgi:hypothetical protein
MNTGQASSRSDQRTTATKVSLMTFVPCSSEYKRTNLIGGACHAAPVPKAGDSVQYASAERQ